MTFLHKLAQRLARLKAALIMGAVATIACEIPLADQLASVFQLQLSPKTSTLRTSQMAQFVVFGLTPTGDTVKFGVTWSATGGTIVDTSTNGGRHYVQYRAPSQPGQYKIIIQSIVPGLSSPSNVAGLSAQSAAAGLSDSAVVNVTAVPVASVSLSPASASVTAGQTVQLTAIPVDSSGVVMIDRVVTWASTNAGVATVNANGMVTGMAAGTATMTATSEGKSATTAVTVAPAPVASVSVSPTAVSVAIGQTAQLTATLRDAGGNVLTGRVVTWTSSNTGLATVSGSGQVTPVGAGTATITATSEGQSGTAAITVTLSPAPVASVNVSPATASVSTGQTVQLTATPRDAGGNVLVGRVVTWAGSGAVASVSAAGLVTGLTAGVATITATSEGQSGSSAVTVTAPVATVSVSPTPTSVAVGLTVQLTATLRDASGNVLTGRVVTWASSNTGLATVSTSGLVRGMAPGVVTITATSESRNGTASVTVTPTPVASVTVSPATASVSAGQTAQLTAMPRDASGNPLTGRTITWSSNALGVATVSGNGLVSGVSLGSATITATSEGQSGSSAVSVTGPVPVASVSVSPAVASVVAGQTVQLTATPRDGNGNVLTGRVVTWGSGNTGVATVSGSGLVTAVAIGLATITATSEGQGGTSSITVTAVPPPGTAWPNEPAGSTLLTDYGFSDALPQGQGVAVGSSGWSINNNGNASRISDPSAPLSTASVGQWSYPIGFQAGAAPATMYYSLNTSQEMFIGLWWKASNPWQNESGSNVNKIFFLMGSGSTDLLIIQLEGPAPWGIEIQAEFNTDNSHLANVTCGSSPGTCLLHGNIAHPTVALGQWHRIELQVKQSTSPTSRNGLMRWWMDGVLIGDYPTVNFPTGNWIEAQISPTWGGGSNTKVQQDYYWFDHLHLSRR